MRLVFIGSSKFGLRCLDLCRQLSEVHIAGVVTAPSKFSISYRPEGVTNVLHADFQSYCQFHNLSCATLEQSMKEPGLMEAVRSWKPDAFLVAGWYHMIPKDWRSLAPAYGLHASLLPDYSGGAPLVWAMINGETQTGITMFQMNDGVDSGPMLGQSNEAIRRSDTIQTLYARIEDRGLELIQEHLPRLAAGSARLQAQDESRRRVFPQRKPEDGKIDWGMDALALDRFVRAQTKPYPGAFTTFDGHKLTIWSASIFQDAPIALARGELTSFKDKVVVGCGAQEALELDQLQWHGEDVQATEWLLRIQSRPADRLSVVLQG